MRLYASSPSPFAAKVRMAARHCGIALEIVPVDTSTEPTELTDANPLGKIPALVTDEGDTVYDSRVICDYFDRLSGNRLLPQTIEAWRKVKTVEALCDGIVDALILQVYEGRYRPEEKHHQPWLDMQNRKVERGLARLEREINGLPEALTTGHFAAGALLSWMGLRFAGRLERDHAGLAAWIERFSQSFEGFEDTRPKLA